MSFLKITNFFFFGGSASESRAEELEFIIFDEKLEMNLIMILLNSYSIKGNERYLLTLILCFTLQFCHHLCLFRRDVEPRKWNHKQVKLLSITQDIKIIFGSLMRSK
jgi:hypothetical protein